MKTKLNNWLVKHVHPQWWDGVKCALWCVVGALALLLATAFLVGFVAALRCSNCFY